MGRGWGESEFAGQEVPDGPLGAARLWASKAEGPSGGGRSDEPMARMMRGVQTGGNPEVRIPAMSRRVGAPTRRSNP